MLMKLNKSIEDKAKDKHGNMKHIEKRYENMKPSSLLRCAA